MGVGGPRHLVLAQVEEASGQGKTRKTMSFVESASLTENRLFLSTSDGSEVALFSVTLHRDKDMVDRMLVLEESQQPN